jgi:endo-1,3(4)-beta-glucanase
VATNGTTPTDPPPSSPVTGSVYIQDVTSGNYVAVVATDTSLRANATQSSASVFTFASSSTLNGTTIAWQATGQFVSADDTGTSALVANRAAASTWETFTVSAQSSGAYLVQARSNGRYLQTTGGNIINSGSGAGSSYRLITVGNPLGTYSLQVASSGLYVTAPAGRETLIADATSASAATRFVFASFNGTTPGGGTIQSTTTQLFVTAAPSGTEGLWANRPTASGWETFVVRPATAAGTYTIQAMSNNGYVVSSASGLTNSATTVDQATVFKFV